MNGDEAFQVGLPAAVATNALLELSAKYAPDTLFNNNDVPETAVNGTVLGVNAVV